jgi:hypothetical protein
MVNDKWQILFRRLADDFIGTRVKGRAPKARQNKAQGGRANEASSETPGRSKEHEALPGRRRLNASPLQGSHYRTNPTQGSGAARLHPGLCSAALSALVPMP